MKSFKIDSKATIVCEIKNTRNGFKHEATLLVNGYEHTTAKCCYLNRTWERFTFESVLLKVLNKAKYLTERRKKNFIERARFA
jgi:hypothetical protein